MIFTVLQLLYDEAELYKIKPRDISIQWEKKYKVHIPLAAEKGNISVEEQQEIHQKKRLQNISDRYENKPTSS